MSLLAALPLALAGAVAGLFAGLLGVGGGLVLVPVLLVWLLQNGADASVATHMALATALATMLATSPVSAWSHYQRGGVDLRRARQWVLPLGIGAIGGAILARWIPAALLKGLFGVLALVLAWRLLSGADQRRRLPQSFDQPALPGFIGLASSWLGIGGGSFSVPALTSFGLPIQRAVGTSALFGLLIAAPATVGYVLSGWSVAGRPDHALGFVHWPTAALLGACAALFAPVGAKLAHTIPRTLLERIFGTFLALAGGRMLLGAIGG